jgi:hypothetical protein
MKAIILPVSGHQIAFELIRSGLQMGTPIVVDSVALLMVVHSSKAAFRP